MQSLYFLDSQLNDSTIQVSMDVSSKYAHTVYGIACKLYGETALNK